ncbi:Dicer-like protein 1 [Massospora cicadina]|nr:Dicer-like protein 1 [Massospora cicadina]
MGSWAASDLKARVVNLALTTNVIGIDSEAERASFAALVIGEALRRPRTLPSNPISFLVDSKGRLEGWVNSFHPRYPCHLGMVAEVGRLKGPEHTQRIPGSYDVVFLEAGTLCELIELAYVVLDEFPLLILDNCRCAKASHPYFQLMRSHYHPLFETARRPRVVGLTSTVFVFVSGVGADAVSVLETMLCADIYVLVTRGWSPTDEAVLNYRAPQKYLAGPPLRAIRDARLSRGFEALSRKALRVNGQLGPYGAALYLDHLMPPQLGALTPDRGLAEAFRSNHAFAEEIGWQLASNPYAFSPQHIAPKVRVLLDYLLAVRATLPRGIILVPIRSVGLGLWLLIQAPKRFETIRCACLFEVGIRHGVETAAMGGPAFQAELRKFRPGTTQLLIVARAAEDGIPILACDVVVQFDLVPNFYAYSQFRAKVGGRTRQQALLVESGGGDRALRKLKATQAEVYRWYLTLSAAQVGGERATRREMGASCPIGVTP